MCSQSVQTQNFQTAVRYTAKFNLLCWDWHCSPNLYTHQGGVGAGVGRGTIVEQVSSGQGGPWHGRRAGSHWQWYTTYIKNWQTSTLSETVQLNERFWKQLSSLTSVTLLRTSAKTVQRDRIVMVISFLEDWLMQTEDVNKFFFVKSVSNEAWGRELHIFQPFNFLE